MSRRVALTPVERLVRALLPADRAAARLGARVEVLDELRIYNERGRANTQTLLVRLAGQGDGAWRRVAQYVTGSIARRMVVAARSMGWDVRIETFAGDSETPIGRRS